MEAEGEGEGEGEEEEEEGEGLDDTEVPLLLLLLFLSGVEEYSSFPELGSCLTTTGLGSKAGRRESRSSFKTGGSIFFVGWTSFLLRLVRELIIVC